MVGMSLKYLWGLLDSQSACWYLHQVSPTSGMEVTRWKMVYVETIPIPRMSASQQNSFVPYFDEILKAKKADSNAETIRLESEIDRMVHELYGLMEEDVAVVECR